MITSKPQNIISKLLAFLLVSFCFAWLIHHYSEGQLAKLNSMSPSDYVQHKRHVYEASYSAFLVRSLVFGAAYLGAFQLVSGIIGYGLRKLTGAEPNGAANRSQPVQPQPSRASAAAGSGR